MKSVMRILGLFVILFISACSSEDEDAGDVLLDPATGLIGGVTWQFDLGTAFLEEVDEKYTINLLGVEEGLTDDGCGILFPGQEYVRFTVDASPGRYDLPFEFSTQGVKFYPPRSVGGFELATSGFVEITEITTNQVTGRIDATLDGDNQVSGSFSVTICN